jgi:hypothetical protein
LQANHPGFHLIGFRRRHSRLKSSYGPAHVLRLFRRH